VIGDRTIYPTLCVRRLVREYKKIVGRKGWGTRISEWDQPDIRRSGDLVIGSSGDRITYPTLYVHRLVREYKKIVGRKGGGTRDPMTRSPDDPMARFKLLPLPC
jgi:hypothetical protein